MSKAFSFDAKSVSMTNESTTTMDAYTFVRLSIANDNSVDLITTRGTVAPFGITQQSIDPSDSGPIAVSGISRLKMGSTGFTTRYVTTPNQITPNASGCGVRATTSVTLELGGIALSTFAASDIVAVQIENYRAVYRT